MKTYYRIMLGKKSIYAAECFAGNFIGADFLENTDLTGKHPENWRDFNHAFIPVHLKENPDKSKVTAGLARALKKGFFEKDTWKRSSKTCFYLIAFLLPVYFVQIIWGRLACQKGKCGYFQSAFLRFCRLGD